MSDVSEEHKKEEEQEDSGQWGKTDDAKVRSSVTMSHHTVHAPIS